jgi:hypothetical protein
MPGIETTICITDKMFRYKKFEVDPSDAEIDLVVQDDTKTTNRPCQKMPT